MKRAKLKEILSKLYMGEIKCMEAETKIIKLYNLLLEQESEESDQ